MQDELANLVYPILSHGLSVRERLEKGEHLDIDIEHFTLKRLLLSEAETRRLPEFADEPGQGDTRFLGIRYALACWLDELLLVHSPWENSWKERSLEAAFYGSERGARFWDQARLVEKRSRSDALEAFFLCVMLGFRGTLRSSPDQLQQWVNATQARLASPAAVDWQGPPELEPATSAPALRGPDRLRHLVVAGSLGLLLLVPFVVFLVVRQVGH